MSASCTASRWHQERRYLVVGARPARADDRLHRRHQFGLHEQVAEGRVQLVGRRRGQHHLGIGGDLDPARQGAAVDQAQPAQLDVVLGRDRDLDVALDAVDAAAELGLGVGEDRLVAGHRDPGRLVRRRPEAAAVEVAQVAEVAPGIAGAVLAPAGQGDVAVPAVAAAGAGQQQMEAAVGQHLHRRSGAAGRLEHAQRRVLDLADRRAPRRPRPNAGGRCRCAAPAPAAAARWPGTADRQRSAAASAGRAAGAPAPAGPCPGGGP
jgi:hypothetical protein